MTPAHELRIYESIADFEAAVRPFLLQREAEHSLLVGITTALKDRPRPESMFMAQVVARGVTVLVGFYTGHLLALSEGSVDDLLPLIEGLSDSGIKLPGVVGPPHLSDAFAKAWTSLKGCSIRSTVSMRIYALHQVTPPPEVEGHARLTTTEDLHLVTSWFREFHEEATAHAPFDEGAVRASLLEKIDAGWSYIWEVDGQPTSFTNIGRPTPHGFTVGPVFTPIDHRRRGYASALVARVSQAALDRGKEFVVLYTDLDNPTSNSIYQKIGYRPVCDSINHWFQCEE